MARLREASRGRRSTWRCSVSRLRRRAPPSSSSRRPWPSSSDRRLQIQLVGEVFAENALAAACAAVQAGVSGADVARGLAACPVVPGRFEVLHRDPIVAVDFAHTPDALARACETARALAPGARVIVVFGAGGERDKGKREPMGKAVASRADEAIITTDNPRGEDAREIARAIAKGAKKGKAKVRLVPDRRAAIESALSVAKRGDVVLIAGKGHERGQIIGTEVLPFSDVDLVRELVGEIELSSSICVTNPNLEHPIQASLCPS